VWLLVGVLIILGTLASLKIGTANDPGPGLLPFLSGILLSIFSITILIKATFQKESEKKNVRQLRANLHWKKVM
jgi:hypothetical protein